MRNVLSIWLALFFAVNHADHGPTRDDWQVDADIPPRLRSLVEVSKLVLRLCCIHFCSKDILQTVALFFSFFVLRGTARVFNHFFPFLSEMAESLQGN